MVMGPTALGIGDCLATAGSTGSVIAAGLGGSWGFGSSAGG